MKTICLMLFVGVMSLTTVAFAQHDAHKATEQDASPEAQKSFETMKGLAGNWEGPVTLEPPEPDTTPDKPVHVSLRVTSRGNALVHEMQESGTPLDATKYDHPVTMIYMDTGRLTLIHYCDAGNRPRMAAKVSPDGKKVEFEFLDLSGGNEYGHMYHAVFTIVDANRHLEDWIYMMPGDKPFHAHFDLKRTE